MIASGRNGQVPASDDQALSHSGKQGRSEYEIHNSTEESVLYLHAIKLIIKSSFFETEEKIDPCYKEMKFMTSTQRHMVQFALMLGLFSLDSLSVSHAQFLDSFKIRNTITANAITRTPVGTRVVLTGSIKSNARRAQYIFQDHTGRTRVRIEREIWRGREINTKNKIEIRGRVENDVRGRFIDVYYFKIIN